MSSLTTITIHTKLGPVVTIEGHGISVEEGLEDVRVVQGGKDAIIANIVSSYPRRRISGYTIAVKCVNPTQDTGSASPMTATMAAAADKCLSIPPETKVAQTKRWRRDMDAILQEMKKEEIDLIYTDNSVGTCENIRARNCAVQTLMESIMWCGMILKALGTADPYPQSKDPSSPVVEKTADGLRL